MFIEAGTVQGLDVALPTHFHMEDQTTSVLSGRRRFIIDSEMIEVVGGGAARIPSGTVTDLPLNFDVNWRKQDSRGDSS